MTEQHTTVLAGQEVTDLWLEGRDAWNRWVQDNPIADIDFSETDFAGIREQNQLALLSFEGFIFPDGHVSFDCADFGKGNVSFFGARFGTGDVSFSRTAFDGDHISFVETDFGNGLVSFSHARFGPGVISFLKARFGTGDVLFYRTVPDTNRLIFEQIKSEACILMGDLLHPEKLVELSFEGASLKESLILPKGTYSAIPDFRNCRLAKPLSFHDIQISKRAAPQGLSILEDSLEPEVEEDISKLRLLAELAEKNRNHRSRLAFRATERRFRRLLNPYGLPSPLDLFFDSASDYGQSLLRPLIGLLLIFITFAFLYNLDTGNLQKALLYSAANTLPVVPASGSLQALHFSGQNAPLAFLQQILAMIFLGLLGLGLWNRWKG